MNKLKRVIIKKKIRKTVDVYLKGSRKHLENLAKLAEAGAPMVQGILKDDTLMDQLIDIGEQIFKTYKKLEPQVTAIPGTIEDAIDRFVNDLGSAEAEALDAKTEKAHEKMERNLLKTIQKFKSIWRPKAKDDEAPISVYSGIYNPETKIFTTTNGHTKEETKYMSVAAHQLVDYNPNIHCIIEIDNGNNFHCLDLD